MSIDYMSLDEAMGDKWRPGVHYVEQAQVRISILAAEVRRLRAELEDALDVKNGNGPTALSMVVADRDRLRAMLEPTPDARELAKEIVDYVSEEEYGAIAFAEKFIAAHDARLLDEAADRAIGWFEDQTWGCEFDGMAITPDLDTLRAAIKGAAHE